MRQVLLEGVYCLGISDEIWVYDVRFLVVTSAMCFQPFRLVPTRSEQWDVPFWGG